MPQAKNKNHKNKKATVSAGGAPGAPTSTGAAQAKSELQVETTHEDESENLHDEDEEPSEVCSSKIKIRSAALKNEDSFFFFRLIPLSWMNKKHKVIFLMMIQD